MQVREYDATVYARTHARTYSLDSLRYHTTTPKLAGFHPANPRSEVKSRMQQMPFLPIDSVPYKVMVEARAQLDTHSEVVLDARRD